MLWLWILLAILFFILLLLLVPIKLYAEYTDDFKCDIYVGLLKFQIYPPKPKKPKKPKAKKKTEQKKEPEKPKEKQSLLKEKGLEWIINLIKQIANLASDALKDFFKHIIVKNLMLSISIAGKDAADTAIKYGYCCSAVYPAVGAITSNVKCKKYGVDIAPNFNEKAETSVSIRAEAKIIVLWLVGLVFKYGIRGLKLLLELKK